MNWKVLILTDEIQKSWEIKGNIVKYWGSCHRQMYSNMGKYFFILLYVK